MSKQMHPVILKLLQVNAEIAQFKKPEGDVLDESIALTRLNNLNARQKVAIHEFLHLILSSDRPANFEEGVQFTLYYGQLRVLDIHGPCYLDLELFDTFRVVLHHPPVGNLPAKVMVIRNNCLIPAPSNTAPGSAAQSQSSFTPNSYEAALIVADILMLQKIQGRTASVLREPKPVNVDTVRESPVYVAHMHLLAAAKNMLASRITHSEPDKNPVKYWSPIELYCHGVFLMYIDRNFDSTHFADCHLTVKETLPNLPGMRMSEWS